MICLLLQALPRFFGRSSPAAPDLRWNQLDTRGNNMLLLPRVGPKNCK